MAPSQNNKQVDKDQQMDTEVDRTIKLGEIVSNLKYTDYEKDRIGNLLAENENVATIFKKYLTKSGLFKNIIRKIKVRGWSKGRPGFETQAIKNIKADLIDERSKCRQDFWELYRHAIAHFIIEERPKLDYLLKSIYVNNDVYESSELIRLICLNAKEYEVSKETVEEFYNIWMFERTPNNISEHLSLCDKTDPIAALNKEIASLKETISSLEERADSLTEKANQHSNDIVSTDAKLKPLQDLVTDLQISIQRNEKNTQEELTLRDSRIDEISKLIETEISQLTSTISSSESTLTSAYDNLLKHQSELKQVINSKLQKALENIDAKSSETAKSTLNYLDSKLDAKTAELAENTRPTITDATPATYRSPLTPDISDAQLRKGKIKTEWDFINIWTHHLKEEMDVYLTVQTATILHILFKASPVLLVDHIRLFKCWIRCLGWEQLEMDIAASPSWINEEDWAIGAKHLFLPSDNKPRILAIHNYDVALTACYLTPTLTLWNLKDGHYPCTKLILIESGSTQKTASSDTLEFATIFPEIELRSNRTYPFFQEDRKWSKDDKKIQHTGVDPEIYSQWFHSVTSNTEIATHIDTIAELENITIPFSLKKHYSIVRDELSHYFSSDDAIVVAAYHIILPWLSAEFDEETANIFYTHLKSLFNNPLAY